MKGLPAISIALALVLLCIALAIAGLGKVTRCGKTYDQSNLRSLVICFSIRFNSMAVPYDPESLQTMEDFLHLLTTVDLTDAAILVNQQDRRHFDSDLPAIFAYRTHTDEMVFDHKILNYPMGFSVAVYPDLSGAPSKTPLLWTRGLDRYAEYKEPYAGYVAFLDGSVVYFAGKHNQHDPRLVQLFAQQGEAHGALRILSNVPTKFGELGLDPLPIRLYRENNKTDWYRIRVWSVFLLPGLLSGLIGMLSFKSSVLKRLILGVLVGAVAQFITVVWIIYR